MKGAAKTAARQGTNDMRKTIGSILVFSAIAFSPTASADDGACDFYGKMGAVFADSMLDLTLRDVIHALNGTRPDIMNDIVLAVSSSMTSADMDALNRLTEEEQNLLGESAGGKSMTLLMEGRASSGYQVRQTLTNECKTRGMRTIMDNQRAANQLTKVQ